VEPQSSGGVDHMATKFPLRPTSVTYDIDINIGSAWTLAGRAMWQRNRSRYRYHVW
jgi:hypothetical protein